MFTRGISKPDQVSSKEEPISDDDGRKLLGKDLYELINQVPKIQDVHQPEKNERKLGEKSSTGQERSETDETLERLPKKFKEEQVNNKYQLIREYLYSSFERCSFTLLDCPLIDIAEDSFDNLMRI